MERESYVRPQVLTTEESSFQPRILPLFQLKQTLEDVLLLGGATVVVAVIVRGLGDDSSFFDSSRFVSGQRLRLSNGSCFNGFLQDRWCSVISDDSGRESNNTNSNEC